MTKPRRRKQHELLPFLAIWADRYSRDYRLDGLHPVHYDLMEKYGAPMERYKRATVLGPTPISPLPRFRPHEA